MSKYLLTAPDEDMARWKAQAEGEGLSFAAWIREACRVASNNVAEYDFVYELVDEQKLKHAKITSFDPPQPEDVFVARTFKPDPKPVKGSKKKR